MIQANEAENVGAAQQEAPVKEADQNKGGQNNSVEAIIPMQKLPAQETQVQGGFVSQNVSPANGPDLANANVAKSILKQPSFEKSNTFSALGAASASKASSSRGRSSNGSIARKKRSPLMQFRQKGTFYRPLFEMFLCYGHEEFFDCRDELAQPGVPLNFSDMLEQRQRRMNRLSAKQEAKAREDQASKGENFSNKAITTMQGSEQLIGVQNVDAPGEDRLDGEGELLHEETDQSCFAMGETRLGESRLDDMAAAYEATLTPEALMSTREARRAAKAARHTRALAVVKAKVAKAFLNNAEETPARDHETLATETVRKEDDIIEGSEPRQAEQQPFESPSNVNHNQQQSQRAEPISASTTPSKARGRIGGGVQQLLVDQ